MMRVGEVVRQAEGRGGVVWVVVLREGELEEDREGREGRGELRRVVVEVRPRQGWGGRGGLGCKFFELSRLSG